MGALDWTVVSAAIVAGVFSCVNTALGFVLFRYLRVPSGGKIGEVMERTHANSAVTAAAVPILIEQTNGKSHEHEEDAA